MGGSGHEKLQSSSSEDSGEEDVEVDDPNKIDDHLPFVEALSTISDKISEVLACPKTPQNKFQNG